MISLLLLVACGGSENVANTIPGTIDNTGELIQNAYGVDVNQGLLDAYLATMPEEKKADFESDAAKKQLSTQLAEEAFFYGQAIEQGVHLEEKTKALLLVNERGLLANVFIKELLEKASSDEAALKAFYEANPLNFRQDQFFLKIVEVSDEASAKAVAKKARAGDDFDALIAADSIEPKEKEKRGELGWIPKNRLPPTEFADAKKGSIVGPIQASPTSFAVLLVADSREVTPFEDVKDKIAEGQDFQKSVIDAFMKEKGVSKPAPVIPPMLQGLDKLPEGMTLPENHSGHGHGAGSHEGHDH